MSVLSDIDVDVISYKDGGQMSYRDGTKMSREEMEQLAETATGKQFDKFGKIRSKVASMRKDPKFKKANKLRNELERKRTLRSKIMERADSEEDKIIVGDRELSPKDINKEIENIESNLSSTTRDLMENYAEPIEKFAKSPQSGIGEEELEKITGFVEQDKYTEGSAESMFRPAERLHESEKWFDTVSSILPKSTTDQDLTDEQETKGGGTEGQFERPEEMETIPSAEMTDVTDIGFKESVEGAIQEDRAEVPESGMVDTDRGGRATILPGVQRGVSQFAEDADIRTGDVIDAAKVGLGMYGATQDLPEFEPPQEYKDYLSRLEDRSYEGLPGETETMAQRQARRGYASDVAQIEEAAGGSGGAVLANLGRASQRLQQQNQKLAQLDAQLRRENLRAYGEEIGGRYLPMKERMFQRDYQQTAREKQAGAQLAAQGLQSLQDRAQYKQFQENIQPLRDARQEQVEEQAELIRAQKRNALENIDEVGSPTTYSAERYPES